MLIDEEHNARLADFGYASLVGNIPGALTYLQTPSLRPGSIRWAAPESLSLDPEETHEHTIKSDIYSYGNAALQVASILWD